MAVETLCNYREWDTAVWSYWPAIEQSAIWQSAWAGESLKGRAVYQLKPHAAGP